MLLVGPAVAKANGGSDRQRSADIRDVEAFHVLGQLCQTKHALEFFHFLLRREVGGEITGKLSLVRGPPDFAEAVDNVAEPGGQFEFHRLRGGAHGLLELFDGFLASAFEELAGEIDPAEVLFVRHLGQRDGHQIGRVFEVFLLGRARALHEHTVFLAHPLHDLPHRTGVRKRAKVAGAIVFLESRKFETRVGLVHADLHHQEPLVVLEHRVVARLVFLDQLAFQKQRLGLALDDERLEIGDGLDERAGLRIPPHRP